MHAIITNDGRTNRTLFWREREREREITAIIQIYIIQFTTTNKHIVIIIIIITTTTTTIMIIISLRCAP